MGFFSTELKKKRKTIFKHRFIEWLGWEWTLKITQVNLYLNSNYKFTEVQNNSWQ